MRITHELIQDAIAKEPELTYCGFYSPAHHRRSERKNTDYVAQLRSYRNDLFTYIKEIQLCSDWLGFQELGQKVTESSYSSYGLKHAVEFATQHAGDRIYVSNGAFLAAVVIAGIPFERVEIASLNALVAVKHYRRNQKLWNGASGYTGFKPFPANYFQVAV